MSKLSDSRCNNQKPPPPSPEPVGSTTANAAVIATAASKALPPDASISCPAWVASGWADAIAAAGGLAACSGASHSSSNILKRGDRLVLFKYKVVVEWIIRPESYPFSPLLLRYLAYNSSFVSLYSGFKGMQSTGHTSTHWGVSK